MWLSSNKFHHLNLSNFLFLIIYIIYIFLFKILRFCFSNYVSHKFKKHHHIRIYNRALTVLRLPFCLEHIIPQQGLYKQLETTIALLMSLYIYTYILCIRKFHCICIPPYVHGFIHWKLKTNYTLLHFAQKEIYVQITEAKNNFFFILV